MTNSCDGRRRRPRLLTNRPIENDPPGKGGQHHDDLAEIDHELKEYVKVYSHERDPRRIGLLEAHIDKLQDDRARAMGFSEEEITQTNAEAEAAVEAIIQAEM
jgi:hypothetical protein